MISQIIEQQILSSKNLLKKSSSIQIHQNLIQSTIIHQNSEPNLQKKSSSITSNQIRKNTCTQCNKTFLKNAHLLRHIEQRHQNNRSFICQFPDCGKTFKRDSHLRRHVISHTHEKPHKCTQCLMAFGYKHHLDRHIKVVHQKQLLKCQECGQKFVKKKVFFKHLQKVHKKTKTASRKSSTKSGVLQNESEDQGNIQLPRKQKKIIKKQRLLFRCLNKQCVSAFTKKHQLIKHLKTVHKIQSLNELNSEIEHKQEQQNKIEKEQIFQSQNQEKQAQNGNQRQNDNIQMKSDNQIQNAN